MEKTKPTFSELVWGGQCRSVLNENAHFSAVVVKSPARLMPGAHKYLLWDFSVFRMAGLRYQPANSKFPTSASVRKKSVFDYS